MQVDPYKYFIVGLLMHEVQVLVSIMQVTQGELQLRQTLSKLTLPLGHYDIQVFPLRKAALEFAVLQLVQLVFEILQVAQEVLQLEQIPLSEKVPLGQSE